MAGDLNRARRLHRAKKYADVIRLLEPQVFRFRESFEFYLLLGMSCLYTGDVAGAYSYLRRANQLDGDNLSCMLALAVVHLKRQELPEALETWLAVQDRDPRNRIARRGLDFARANSDPGIIAESLSGRRMARFLPPSGALVRAIPGAAVALAVAALLVFLVPLGVKVVQAPRGPQRVGLDEMNLPASDRVADSSGQFRYVLTRNQILQSFDRMKRDFATYRDNLAQHEANILLESNAAESIKEKARLLSSYLRPPNFASIRDSFGYVDVEKDPFLYQNCYVDWKGMVSNLAITPKAIKFDFLVGYHTEQVLQGIVPVTLSFAAAINSANPLEVLGKVTIVGGRITLQGISLHELAPISPTDSQASGGSR